MTLEGDYIKAETFLEIFGEIFGAIRCDKTVDRMFCWRHLD